MTKKTEVATLTEGWEVQHVGTKGVTELLVSKVAKCPRCGTNNRLATWRFKGRGQSIESGGDSVGSTGCQKCGAEFILELAGGLDLIAELAGPVEAKVAEVKAEV